MKRVHKIASSKLDVASMQLCATVTRQSKGPSKARNSILEFGVPMKQKRSGMKWIVK